MATDMLSIEANGVNLAYLERGQGHSVVFVHGGFMDYRAWGSEIGPFSQRYRVIAYSRRYARPNARVHDGMDSSVSANEADLVALINKLKLAPVHLVGHSYGGLIALNTALHHPELVRPLVLEEPAVMSLLVKNPKNPLTSLLSLFFTSPGTAIALMKAATTVFKPVDEASRRGDSEKAMRMMLDGLQNKEDALEQLPPPVRAMCIENAESLKAELDSAATTTFTCEDAHHVLAPTLLVKGALSPRPGHYVVDRLARCIPNNEVVTISGVAHMLHTEKPDEFNEKVLDFLARHGTADGFVNAASDFHHGTIVRIAREIGLAK